jgi:endonuclease/exonuclease/phosphatase family metal-dependent hydrolase
MGISGEDEQYDDARPGIATLTVMTYNILAGGGSRLQQIGEIIHDVGADVVGLQEVLRPDWVGYMADTLGMSHVIGKAPDNWSLALLSRYPILETRTHTAPQVRRCVLESLIDVPGSRPLRVIVAHLHAGYSAFRAGEAGRVREVRFAIERMQEARRRSEPHLLMGDLNSLAPGERLEASLVLRHTLEVEERERASGRRQVGHPNLDNILPAPVQFLLPLLVPAFSARPVAWLADRLVNAYVPRWVVRRLARAGYTDLYAETHPKPQTRGYTCPMPFAAGRIDYIFADPLASAGLLSSEIVVDGPRRDVTHASDHRPVMATLRPDAW